MRFTQTTILLPLLCLGALVALPLVADHHEKKAEVLQVLIIDGQNNHNWKDTSPFLKSQLEATGRFRVEISTTPPKNGSEADWRAWKPAFSYYDVVLSNYNGPAWPNHVRKAFQDYIRRGGTLVNVHAANNAHQGWDDFEQMTGLLWRNNKQGHRVFLNTEGDEIRIAPGKGPGAGHGPQHAYPVTIQQPDHPITAGMPASWMHAKDELYHGQRGPGLGMHVLVTAMSAEDKKGTGVHEPILWWIPYGDGKVITNVLGHANKNDTSEFPAMRCVGFLTLLARSCEWGATDQVSIPVPGNFPTSDDVSILSE